MEERLHTDELHIQVNTDKIVKLEDLFHIMQLQTKDLENEAGIALAIGFAIGLLTAYLVFSMWHVVMK